MQSLAYSALLLATQADESDSEAKGGPNWVDAGLDAVLEAEKDMLGEGSWGSDLENLDQIVVASILVLFGTVVTFKGGKWFKGILFLIGGVAGALCAHFVMDKMDTDITYKVHLTISAGVGIFVGACCVMVYRASVFTTGAFAGLIAGQFIWQFAVVHFPDSFLMKKADLYNAITIGVLALIGGALAFKAMDVALKGLTAFIGSFCVTSAIAYFIARYVSEDPDANVLSLVEFFESERNVKNMEDFENSCGTECVVSLGIWVTFFFSGLVYQYGWKGKTSKKTKTDNVARGIGAGNLESVQIQMAN